MVGTQNEATRIKWLRQKLIDIPAGSRILDAGAGEQRFKEYCSHLKYISQDFAQYNGEGNNKALQMGTWDQNNLDIVSDITEIPEPDSSFDAILCVEVFEHIPQPLLAFQEFSRLLKPNGKLILTAPFCSLTHFSPYHFYSGFNRYFYEVHLPTYGFEVLEIAPNGNFFEYLAQELNRVYFISDRYSCDKPRIWESVALRIVLRMLQRFTSQDIGSSELLCYGYHIYAVKNS